jgi:hypothetical protein
MNAPKKAAAYPGPWWYALSTRGEPTRSQKTHGDGDRTATIMLSSVLRRELIVGSSTGSSRDSRNVRAARKSTNRPPTMPIQRSAPSGSFDRISADTTMTAVSDPSGTTATRKPAQKPWRSDVTAIRAVKGPGTTPEKRPSNVPGMSVRTNVGFARLEGGARSDPAAPPARRLRRRCGRRLVRKRARRRSATRVCTGHTTRGYASSEAEGPSGTRGAREPR